MQSLELLCYSTRQRVARCLPWINTLPSLTGALNSLFNLLFALDSRSWDADDESRLMMWLACWLRFTELVLPFQGNNISGRCAPQLVDYVDDNMVKSTRV